MLVPLWKQSWAPHLVVVPIVIGCVWLAELVGATTTIRGAWEAMLLPLSVTIRNSVTWVYQPFQLVRNTNELVRRLQQVEYRYAEASAQLGELAALQAENEQLKEALSARTSAGKAETTIAAPLVSLAYPAIAAGSAEGIQSGRGVYIAETLVGTIGQLSDHQAEVHLLSQTDQRPILVQTESGAQGIVVGDGRRVLLTEIPSDQQLTIGERVVTLGQPGIKRDALVGRIQRLEQKTSAPVQTAVIEQYVSFYRARLVFVE